MNQKFPIVFLFATVIVLSSCGRGIEREPILAMPDGTAKDSAYLYYSTGLTKGRVLLATDTFFLNTRADSKFSKGLHETPPEGETYGLPIDDYRGAQVLPGDSLLIVGGFRQHIVSSSKLKKDKLQTYVQVQVSREGKQVAQGWNYYGSMKVANPKASNAWNEIFGSDTASYVADILMLSLAFLILFWIWKLIYKLIYRKTHNGDDPFWKNETLYSKAVFYLLSGLLAFLFFLIKVNEPMFLTLRYNPDLFARYGEYPLGVQALPFVLLLWVVNMGIMLWEMIRKFRTPWVLIYFLGTLAFGSLLISLVMTLSTLIYAALPTVLIFAVLALTGGNGSGSGSGSGSGKKQENQYIDYRTGKKFSSHVELNSYQNLRTANEIREREARKK